MQTIKYNVFHCHIADYDAFPLKLPSVFKLVENGAYSIIKFILWSIINFTQKRF